MRSRVSALLCLFAVVFVGAGIQQARAVELLGPPQVKPSATGAIVSWNTDVACGTRLEYGLSAGALVQKAEGAVTSRHEVQLQGLKPDTTYHFSVGSARKKLGTGSFITLGATGSQAPPGAPAPAAPPSLVRRVLDAVLPSSPARPGTSAGAAATPPPAAPSQAAPPTRQTWANLATLQDHFERHGRDFSSKSPEDYAAEAWRFLQIARTQNLPMKLDDTDNTLRVFDPKTRAFAAYNGAGRTKTYFKPGSPDYWQRQPGRPVTSAQLPFPLQRP